MKKHENTPKAAPANNGASAKSATSSVTRQKTRPLGIMLDRKLVAKARKAARRSGSSLSAYVEDAILEFIGLRRGRNPRELGPCDEECLMSFPQNL